MYCWLFVRSESGIIMSTAYLTKCLRTVCSEALLKGELHKHLWNIYIGMHKIYLPAYAYIFSPVMFHPSSLCTSVAYDVQIKRAVEETIVYILNVQRYNKHRDKANVTVTLNPYLVPLVCVCVWVHVCSWVCAVLSIFFSCLICHAMMISFTVIGTAVFLSLRLTEFCFFILGSDRLPEAAEQSEPKLRYRLLERCNHLSEEVSNCSWHHLKLWSSLDTPFGRHHPDSFLFFAFDLTGLVLSYYFKGVGRDLNHRCSKEREGACI